MGIIYGMSENEFNGIVKENKKLHDENLRLTTENAKFREERKKGYIDLLDNEFKNVVSEYSEILSDREQATNTGGDILEAIKKVTEELCPK